MTTASMSQMVILSYAEARDREMLRLRKGDVVHLCDVHVANVSCFSVLQLRFEISSVSLWPLTLWNTGSALLIELQCEFGLYINLSEDSALNEYSKNQASRPSSRQRMEIRDAKGS